MPLTFAGTVDREVVLRTTEALVDLVSAPEVADAWDRESALPGMTVGGLTRHLVSQPECAVEFLGIQPVPPHAPVLSLVGSYERTDWFGADVDAVENTSIRDDFNAMAAGGPADSVQILVRAQDALPAALASAGTLTYVPWQDCALATDDFLTIRLMEMVVHVDDLAVSVGRPTPVLEDDAVHPALALLAMLASMRHGHPAAVRALSRRERASRPATAF